MRPAALETIQRVRETPGGQPHRRALSRRAGSHGRAERERSATRGERSVRAPGGRLHPAAQSRSADRSSHRSQRLELTQHAHQSRTGAGRRNASPLPLRRGQDRHRRATLRRRLRLLRRPHRCHAAAPTSPGTEPGPASVAQLRRCPRASRIRADRRLRATCCRRARRSCRKPGSARRLESLLATAERRVLSVRNSSIPPSDRLSPEAELEAILPSDVLDALDEPLDFDDDDDDDDSSIGTHNGAEGEQSPRSTTKTTGAGTASGGGNAAPEILDPLLRTAREKTAAPHSSTDLPVPDSPESQSSRATEPPVTPPRQTSRMRRESELRSACCTRRSPRSAVRRTRSPAPPLTARSPTCRPAWQPAQSEPAASLSTVPPAPRPYAERAPAEVSALAPAPRSGRVTP